MADYKNIAEVVKEAFEFAEHSDGNEHLLVEKLKDSSAFVPSLSLVACDDKKSLVILCLQKVMWKKKLF